MRSITCSILLLVAAALVADARLIRLGEQPPSSSSLGAAVAEASVERKGGAASLQLASARRALHAVPLSTRTCPKDIAGCQDCNTTSKICNKCYTGFERVSGGKQCRCPPGTYGGASPSGVPMCLSPGAGFYAAGGARNALTNAAALGTRNQCGKQGVSTRSSNTVVNLNARSISDCRTLPGWVITGTDSKTKQLLTRQCDLGEFNPGFNNATQCTKCVKGSSTRVQGAASRADCTVVLPGYYASKVAPRTPAKLSSSSGSGRARRDAAALRVAAAAAAPAAPTVFVVDTELCPVGSYNTGDSSTGGGAVTQCASCGVGLTTDAEGATSPDYCTLAEGYGSKYDEATGMLTAFVCPADTYRSGVAMGINPKPCSPCPAYTNTLNVTGATDMWACVGHPAGYGVTSYARLEPCPAGQFNAADSNFEPCQFCPAYMTTAADPARQAAVADCFPQPGYGVYIAPTGLSPDGSDGDVDVAGFAWDLATLKAAAAAASNGSDGGDLVAGLVGLPVVACPVGYVSAPAPAALLDAAAAGLSPEQARRLRALAQQCPPCPDGSTTEDSGAGSVAACKICAPGYERRDGACKPCARGSFNPYSDGTCEQCEDQYFFLGTDSLIFVPGVTPNEGATAPGECVAKVFSSAQELPDSVLFSGLDADLRSVGAVADFPACMAACKPGTLCVALLQKDELTCTVAEYPAAPSVGAAVAAAPFSVHVKLPGSDTQGLGAFTSGTTTHAWSAAPAPQGLEAPVAAGDASTLAPCREACAGSPDCAAFVFDKTASKCYLKAVTLAEKWTGFYSGVVQA